jgi:acid phosphatase (class A)
LILAEMVPVKADSLLQRGFDFGQSRVVCGVHWQSDVNAGRVVAAAVVAQLRANSDFEAQFRAAQKEVVAARATARIARSSMRRRPGENGNESSRRLLPHASEQEGPGLG